MRSATSGFDYFDHDADIGVIGRGECLESAFIAAAEGVFALMTDLMRVRALQAVTIDFYEEDSELALMTWLNTLLGQARARGLLFAKFELHYAQEHSQKHWKGIAYGEPIYPELVTGTEVKGATLTMLRVHKIEGVWEAACVVDL